MKNERIFIDENSSMIKAMETLDKTAKKVLFVKKEGILVASITDGDIRRWILVNGTLEGKVSDMANYNPLFLHERERKNAKTFMIERHIEAVPLVNDKKEIVSIVYLNRDDEYEVASCLDIPVVIMAGGLGTRLYPYTKILPKPLIPIGDIPIAEHIMDRFHKFGVKKFFLVVNHKKNMIKAYFNDVIKNYSIDYVEEEKALGTGGGLSLLKDKINSTFVLSNCDILIEEDYERIYSYHKKEKNLITLVCSLKNISIPYGVIDINDTGGIEEMREKPQISFFTNTGMYIVEPDVICDIEDGKAVGFPDIIDRYRKVGEKIGVYPIGEDNWLDMGQLDQMENMREKLNLV